MVRIVQVMENLTVKIVDNLDQILLDGSLWHWVDLFQASEEETFFLAEKFRFNPQLLEDRKHVCLTPKIEDLTDYRFFILQGAADKGPILYNLCLFVGRNYLVSYHQDPILVVDRIFEKYGSNKAKADKGLDYLLYHLISQIVEEFLPVFSEIGSQLERLEEKKNSYSNKYITEDIFFIRKKLLAIRRSLVPFQEVITRIIHPEEPEWETNYHELYGDEYNHISRLIEMTEFYREMCQDLIESVNSLNSERVNHVILLLTVITTIFMPLTFIAGVYGMNFDYMPELHWRYGYPLVLVLMAGIAGTMVLWFRKKGWL